MIYKVEADITDLKKKLSDAEKETEKLGGEFKQLATEINKSMGSAASSIDNVGTTAPRAFEKTKAASDKAGNALLNLGRIAQDAPFGFIGITNNINPMLESFQRLKAETGSTKGAITALVGSLAGGAGLGLAVSVATGLLTVLAQKGFFTTTKAADDAKKSVDAYKDAVNGVFSSVAKEVSEVTALIAVLSNETETRKRKIAAMEELKKISPEIFNGLKLEGTAVQGLTSAYSAYIENLKNVIAAKVTQAKLEQKITKLLELQGVAGNTEQRRLSDSIVKSYQAQITQLQKVGANPKAISDIQKAIDQITKPNKREIELLDGEIKKLTDDLREFSKGVDVNDVSKGIDISKAAAKTKGDIKTISDVLAELQKQLAFFDKEAQLFGGDFRADKVSAILGTIQTLLKDFKVNPNDQIIFKLFGDASKIKFELARDIIRQRMNEALKGLTVEAPPLIVSVPESDPNVIKQNLAIEDARRKAILQQLTALGVSFNPASNIEALQSSLDAALARHKAYTEQVKAMYEQFTIDITAGSVEAFAGFLSGTSTLAQAFESILGIIGSFLVQLGKAAVQQSLIIKALQKASPTLGLAAGIAAIALGTLLKNTKLQGFAGGVTNFSGGAAIVGERGKELVTLPRGASVTPNNMLPFVDSGMGGFVAETRISGQDLLILVKRSDASYNKRT